MGTSITIRDVPDDVRDELAARAARARLSLDDYVRSLLVGRRERADRETFWAGVGARVEAAGTQIDPSSLVRARDEDRA
jgi:antitoxin FitA